MAGKASCKVNPAFVQKINLAKLYFPEIVAGAMNQALKLVVKEASRQAPWQRDGVDTGSWEVTGFSRATFVGYVPKYFPPVIRGYHESDKYGRLHFSDAALLRQSFPDSPFTIRAVVARYAHSTPYLQQMEQGQLRGFGRRPGPPKSFRGYYGEVIEVKVMREMAPLFWKLVATNITRSLRRYTGGRSGFIF